MSNFDTDMKALAGAFFANLEIDNCEYGGVGVDSKRPFGNSDVEGDILEIVGQEPNGDDGHDTCWSSNQREYARELYHERLIPYLKNWWKVNS